MSHVSNELPVFVSAGDILTDLVRTGASQWLSRPGGAASPERMCKKRPATVLSPGAVALPPVRHLFPDRREIHAPVRRAALLRAERLDERVELDRKSVV